MRPLVRVLRFVAGVPAWIALAMSIAHVVANNEQLAVGWLAVSLLLEVRLAQRRGAVARVEFVVSNAAPDLEHTPDNDPDEGAPGHWQRTVPL